jgi:hypothetical protein
MSNKRYKSADIDKRRIREAYNWQQSRGWSFYLEREFIENLMANRFNCLLVMYSLFITAFVGASNARIKVIILILGLIITLLVSLTIYRVYVKLIILLKFLHDLEENDVVPFVDREVDAMKYFAFFGVNRFIAIIIPCIFIFSFILLLALTLTGSLYL